MICGHPCELVHVRIPTCRCTWQMSDAMLSRWGWRDSIGAGSVYSAPVQYVFDDDSIDDDDIEVVSTSGRNISQLVILILPLSVSIFQVPRRTSIIPSAASNALHTNSIGSYLSSSYKKPSFRTRSSYTRDDDDQSSTDTSVRANSTRRVRRNSLWSSKLFAGCTCF